MSGPSVPAKEIRGDDLERPLADESLECPSDDSPASLVALWRALRILEARVRELEEKASDDGR